MRRRTARHARRLAARVRAGAALCKVPLVDWVKLPRAVRKAMRRTAKWKARQR